MMNEKRDFRLQRNTHPLTPEKLAQILRQVTVEREASETFKRLTGEEIPEIEEIDEISADDVDVIDERRMRAFDPTKTMTFTIKLPRIIDTTAREIREEDKIRGLRASANCVDDFTFLEEEE